MKIGQLLSLTGSSLKSIIKVLTLSRPSTIRSSGHTRPLVVLGNGPSLKETMTKDADTLRKCDLLAVNFFANTPEYLELRPRYYVMADPHFFTGRDRDPNVEKLWERLSSLTDWEMTLFVPGKMRRLVPIKANQHIDVKNFNPVGAEGFPRLERFLYSRKHAMPRPRNVLIPSIMIGIWLGYTTIYIAGADHSWMKTLSVTEDNTVVSVQPHFYADNDSEHSRVASVYTGLRLHDVIQSFYIAFRAYHRIRAFADSIGVNIWNVTPGSFIDAFPRNCITSDN